MDDREAIQATINALKSLNCEEACLKGTPVVPIMRSTLRHIVTILEGSITMEDELYNEGIVAAQMMVRKWAINYAQNGDDKCFQCLEDAADAMDNLKREEKGEDQGKGTSKIV